MIKDNIVKRIIVIWLIFLFIIISFIPALKGNYELIDKTINEDVSFSTYRGSVYRKVRGQYRG